MKKSAIVITAICLICLTCVLCACGDKNSAQQAHEHSYTLVEADDPTCTESGNVLYYTCTCGKFFDSEKKEIEESQTVVPALGHDYEMTWTSADNETAQVVLTCRRDDTHVYQCSGTVVTDRTEATCDADGEIRYTVTIEYDDKTYADTHTQSIGKLDHHNYSTPTWTWDAQHTKATAHFVCADYSQHTLDVVDDEIDIQIVDSTCTQAGTKTYTASVEVYGQSYETTFEENISLKNHAYGENGTCENCGRIKDMLIFGTLQEGEGDTYYGKVSNATTSFSFRDEVTARSDTTYAVYTDAAHETAISLEAAPLNIGDNTFYILAEREGDERLFTVTIRRRPVYTVNFETSGSAVEQQSVEEDADITSPADTTKTGYTFEHWTLNGAQIEFPYKVENGVHCTEGYVVTITAVFNANNYTVTFNKNGGDLDESEASVTYDQPYKLPIPTREGHTFLGWYLDETQLTDEEGVPVSDQNWTYAEGKTVTAHWSANAYMLTVEKNIPYAGEATDGGTFTYGNEVTVTATTYLGYEFLGWYNEAEENVCQDETYTFAMGLAQTLTATYQVIPEMTDFEFTSDLSTCEITGVKNSEVSQITIPDFVTSIGYGAFANCTDLRTVTICNGLTTIGTDAFNGCTGLSEITIPDSVQNIGYGAFACCTGITKIVVSSLKSWCEIEFEDYSANPLYYAYHGIGHSSAKFYVKKNEIEEEITGDVKIPEDIEKIGIYAFYGLAGITSVTIPEQVESIGEHAFECCNSIKTFSVAEGNSVYQSKDGVVYIKEDKSIYIVPKAIDGAVTILDGCTNIGMYAFSGCNGLSGITIPTSVKRIDISAFSICTGLGEIKIPDSVESIEDFAFAGCTNLQTVTIGEGVTSLSDRAFNGSTGILTATMPAIAISGIPKDSLNTVTITSGDIPNNAFKDCEGLQTLTIGEGVTSISENAFDNCTGIRVATLPAKYIINIPKYELITVTITNGVTTDIPDYAFANCQNLQTVTIDNGVTSIGCCAFQGCWRLSKITIPDSVTTVRLNAFSECIEIIKVNYLGTLKGWCEILFEDFESNPLVAPNNSKIDKAHLYVKNEGVEEEVTGEVNIPDGTTKIGIYAFYGLTGITSVTIPGSVKSIEYSSFEGCNNIKAFDVAEGNSVYQSEQGVVYKIEDKSIYIVPKAIEGAVTILDGCENIIDHAFSGCEYLSEIIIPDTVRSIGNDAFFNCPSLQTVTISKNVTSIGEDVFEYCPNITTTTMPALAISCIPKDKLNNVTITCGDIPEYAFQDCEGLQTLTIGEGVTSIGNDAFNNCSGITAATLPAKYINNIYKSELTTVTITSGEIPNEAFRSYTTLTTVTIGSGVTNIGSGAFEGCTSLTKVVVHSLKSWCEIEFGNDSANPVFCADGNAKLYLKENDEEKEVTGELNIPDGTTKIGDYVFYNYTAINSVTMPESVQSIGGRAFQDCEGLQTLTIGEGVLSIGEHAFDGCASLTTVNWNATNCTEAGSKHGSIFVGCTTLTTVNIGDNVQTIPAYTFYECASLQTVTISRGVLSIGEHAFAYCTNLTTVNWNAINCTTAGSADEPIFYGCEQLTTLNIGDNVQSIPEHAFDGCENILEATLPAAVILSIPRYNLKAVTITNGDIPDNAFDGCASLQTVTIGENVTSIGDRAFEGCTNITTATMPALAISGIRTDSLNTVTITCGYIQYDAFWGCPVLQTVTIGEGVIGIGQLAFGNCTSLTTVNWNAINCTIAGNFGNPIFKDCKQLATVNIADNVQSIPNFAFLYCTALSEIEIPGSVQSIGDCAFEGCTNLQTVTLCKGLQSIGEAAFCYCEKLSEIIIPNSVTSIGYSAFSGCAALSEIEIPGSVASINEGAFSGCASLQTVTIGENVQSIGEGAFSGCASLQTVTIGENVTSIGDRAFEGCTALSEIEIPGSVTSIGGYAFSGCKGLKTVIIPASVTNIGEWAFDYCYQITEVNYSGTFEQWCEIDFGNNNANPLRVPENDVKFTCNGEVIDLTDLSIPEDITKIGSYVFSGLTDITSVTIPYGVTSIGAYAFSDCTGLKTVIIPASVTSIGEDAFVGCSSITEVNYSGTFEQWCEIDFGKNNANPLRVHENDVKFTCNGEAIVLTDLSIPEDITKIGSYVFSGLTDITSVTIPDGVTSIGDGAFESCINLKTVTIPASVTRIGANAFWYCTNIEAVNYSGTFKQWCEMDFGNSTANPLVFAKNTVVFTCNGVGIDLTDLSIPKDITKIGSYVFCRLRGITSITIPYGVTIIGEGAFEGCADLSEIDIPGSVTSIGDGAFAGCWNLSEIKIPDGVTSIGAGAFYGCTSLSVIEIPGSVTSIGDGAFEGCEDLKTVIIPAGVTIIGEGAFASCTGLSEIEIPGSVTSIGDEAFYGCEGLSEIKIPDSVQSIGYKAFSGCTSLHTVTIGKGMQRIDTEAFDYCENLKDIYYSGDEMQWELIWKGGYWDGMRDYQMHYSSTGPEAASDISAMTSELPILIASDRLDLWVKQDQIEC